MIFDMRKTHSNIGVCCDFGNTFRVSEEPYRIFEEHADLIRHVHFKDYVHKNEPFEGAEPAFRGGMYIRRSAVGDGCIDVERLAKIIKSSGYSGDASVEDWVDFEEPGKIGLIMEKMNKLFD